APSLRPPHGRDAAEPSDHGRSATYREPRPSARAAARNRPADRSGRCSASPRVGPGGHSHSMVPGGLEVMSRVTRLISLTSLVMRLEILESTSKGTLAQSAVIASSLVTGRSTIGWP